MYGTFSTKELVQAAVEQGATAMALTNINSTCDVWDFVQYCREEGIKPIAGVEIRNSGTLLYILLAANNRGLEWIHRFVSDHIQSSKAFPLQLVAAHFFDYLSDGFVVYPLHTKPPDALQLNERIGVKPSEVNLLFNIDFKKYRHAFVIRQPVTFQNKTYYNLHRLLRAIDKNVLLSKLPVDEVCGMDEYFVSPTSLLDAFRQYPMIVTNTYQLMDACSVEMEFHQDKNKKTFSATAEDDRVLLAKLTADGFKHRYGGNKTALARIEKELKIINDLGFNAYFLITWDLVRYARSRGFFYVGRGSGANSIVAYCLQITDVDPIELDLYFERFLNPHRTSPPDFDIDFSWLDRDEVIDYIFKRYGKNQVALLGMYATFQYRASLRELGKVFGLPKEEIDAFIHHAPPQDNIHRLMLRYAKLMENFPSHLSIHPGGILISEAPIYNYATICLPPKGFATAQLDMFVAENIGLYKLDILSQRGLGHIKESLRLIRKNKGIDIDIHDIEAFKKDVNIRRQIQSANTIGCFYIESPAMRQLLRKLRCEDYITLVAASSIIRPGVAQSGMMKQYIYRYHHPDQFEYLHPIMEKLLKETYGVMVFQEDVIKVAHYFAGLDLGEADVLRRAMSGKYRSSNQFQLIKEKFFSNCAELGHPEALAKEVWRQMESFAGYSFNKAHSASFAVESYQSLYLKTYYPREFMVAVINNFGGFYNHALYFMELSKTGVAIHPPCVNQSNYYTDIRGEEVYVGFVHIKSLQHEMVQAFLNERATGGCYLHLQDFIERTAIGMEQLNTLISIGAFRFTQKNKKQLLWEANFLHKKNNVPIAVGKPLFNEAPRQFQLPELHDHPLDDVYDQLELLEFMLQNPFVLADDDAQLYHCAQDLPSLLGKEMTVLAYFVDRKVVRTIRNEIMSFGTFVDVHLDWIDTVHFPDSLKYYPLKGNGFYRITGKVVEEFGVHSIEVKSLLKVGYKQRSYKNL